MTQRYSLALEGSITAVTPVAITRPDQGDKLLTMSVVVGSSVVACPVIPGETIKGRFRRASAEIFRQSIMADPRFAQAFPGRDTPWSLDQMYVQVIGGIKGAGKESPADLLRSVEIRRRNPVLSLYGAAVPIWMSGLATFDPAFPEAGGEGMNLPGGSRRDPLRDNPDLIAAMSDADRERWLKQSSLTSQRSALSGEVKLLERKVRRAKGAENPDRAEIAEIEAHLKDAKSRLAAVEGDPEYSNAVSRPLDGKNAIPAGTLMSHRMAVNGGTLAEIGLFVETLRLFAADPQIGGHRTTGYGRIAMDYRLKVRRHPDQAWKVAGRLSVSHKDGFVLEETQDTLVSEAVAAWRSAATDILSGAYDVGKAA
jgi:CRISPR/Cas system CSM-associated protein Csm3 (group 7 of RAMP superfamily)